MAVEFAKTGFQVAGIDVNSQKVARVNAGDSYLGDIPNGVLASLVRKGMLRATADFGVVRDLRLPGISRRAC